MDMYDDGPTNPGTTAPKPDGADSSPKAGSDDNTKTYLINKEVCPKCKVGEELVVEIVGITENEYEVKYAPGPGGEGDEGGEKAEMAEAPGPSEEGGNPMPSLYS